MTLLINVKFKMKHIWLFNMIWIRLKGKWCIEPEPEPEYAEIIAFNVMLGLHCWTVKTFLKEYVCEISDL